jgi:uncharacterized transporter YbjL
MAAAGNSAFRQVGGALGPAVLGAVLSTKAVHTLPGHLTDVGLPAATVRSVTSAVDAGGLGAVAGMNLGADRGRALGALSEAFLDGLHLCLIIAAVLTLVAAAVGAVLLRSPRRPATGPVAGSGAAPAALQETGAAEPRLGRRG